MTDEKKALELSSMSKYDFTVEECNAAYNAAIEMEEWKDEQFVEKLDKWIAYRFPFMSKESRKDLIDDIVKTKIIRMDIKIGL